MRSYCLVEARGLIQMFTLHYFSLSLIEVFFVSIHASPALNCYLAGSLAINNMDFETKLRSHSTVLLEAKEL